jgi:hypothetical protein
MECQLRPLVYSLDLNNSPRIGLTPGKLRAKNLWRNKQGALDVKWRELELSLLPSSALKCVPGNAKGLRQSRGLWCSAENLRAKPFHLWHSAVKFYQGVGIPQYTVLASGGWHSAVCLSAECQGLKTVARFVAFRGNLSTECQQRLNSSTRHFTSTVPLFIAS